jgi:deazaflavin-dependent oxidoreductase (nitroreductase family)
VDARVRAALASDRVIDITTTGRRSGAPRRLEIWMHQIDGRLYITGLPGPRAWHANLLADPAFTLHLKESATADLPATARDVADPAERRAVLTRITTNIGRADDVERWITDSPLVEAIVEAAA